MGLIQDLLVVRVGMDGVHEAALDAELVHKHLGERRKAVGGAGSVGNDVVLSRVVLVVVDAHNDGDVLVLGGSRDKDLLGAGFDVLLGLVGIGEEARGLDNQVYADFAPRDVQRVAVAEHANLMAIDNDEIALDLDLVVNTAMDGIVLQKMGVSLGAARIVDSDDVECRILLHRAENKSADTTEAVDTNLGCHVAPLSCL